MAKQSTPWRKLSVGAVLGSVLLSGCFGSSNKNITSVKSNEKVTLTMWGLFDNEAVWKPIIRGYEQANPNITINYVVKDYANYEEDSFDSLAARTGPDIWTIKNDWMPRDYEKLVAAPTAVMPLTTYKNSVPDVAYNDSVIDGKVYGVPMSVDTLVLYYNRDQFSKKRNELDRSNVNTATQDEDLRQAPLTWKDVVRYDGLLTQKDGDGKVTRAGIALGANNVDQSQDILSALMLQTGTQMVTADRKSAGFNLSQTIASGKVTAPGNDALTFFRSFSDSSNANYTWPTDFPNSIDAFEQGKVSMIIQYNYLANRLKQDVPTLNYAIAPLPQVEGATTATDYASYWLETVTKSSAHSDVAWDFLKYAQSQTGTYASGAGRPTSTRLAASAGPNTLSERITLGNTADFQKLTAVDWYKGRRPIEVDNIFHDLINAVLGGDAVQHALDSAAKRVTDLLSGQTPAPFPSTTN